MTDETVRIPKRIQEYIADGAQFLQFDEPLKDKEGNVMKVTIQKVELYIENAFIHAQGPTAQEAIDALEKELVRHGF